MLTFLALLRKSKYIYSPILNCPSTRRRRSIKTAASYGVECSLALGMVVLVSQVRCCDPPMCLLEATPAVLEVWIKEACIRLSSQGRDIRFTSTQFCPLCVFPQSEKTHCGLLPWQVFLVTGPNADWCILSIAIGIPYGTFAMAEVDSASGAPAQRWIGSLAYSA